MARNVPERIKTKAGHSPRARIHAAWSPIGQKMRRTALLHGLGGAVAVMLVIGVAADAYAQSFFDGLPSIQGLDSAAFAGDTIIYDSTGKVVLADVGNHGDHRLAVKLKDVAPTAIQATVAIEDRGFYTNPGFDLAGIVRATFDNLRAGHIVGGGSTITQQLARQQFLTPDQTISRKIKEIALAYELSQTYSKDQIMELYLNKSFYGSQSYGIEAASESYFQVPASKLDLAQSAMLAGLPQAPTEWNPVLHPDQAKLRQTEVLRAMVRSNFISQEDMDKALAEKLNYYAPVNRYKAPHFVDYVLAELRQLGFQPGIQQLNVKTTLDWTMQQVGESTVANNMSRIACNARHSNYGCDIRGVLSSGLVAIDPHTGDIMVMVGSPNYNSDGGWLPDHPARARRRHRHLRGHGRLPLSGGGPPGDRFPRQGALLDASGPAGPRGRRSWGRFHHGPDHGRRPEPVHDLRLQQRPALEGPDRRRQDRHDRQLQGRGHGGVHP